MTNKCINCNKEIENNPSRTKRFCCDACRKAYSRRTNDVGQNQVGQPTIQEGICHGCGRKIIDIKEQWVHGIGNEKDANNICICLPCVQKGITHESLGLDIKKCLPL